MTYTLVRPADSGAVCDQCSTGVLPVAIVGPTPDACDDLYLCVSCLASAIDSVTGWRIANVVRANLSISPATERFRHPERFTKSGARRPTPQHKETGE